MALGTSETTNHSDWTHCAVGFQLFSISVHVNPLTPTVAIWIQL